MVEILPSSSSWHWFRRALIQLALLGVINVFFVRILFELIFSNFIWFSWGPSKLCLIQVLSLWAWPNGYWLKLLVQLVLWKIVACGLHSHLIAMVIHLVTDIFYGRHLHLSLCALWAFGVPDRREDHLGVCNRRELANVFALQVVFKLFVALGMDFPVVPVYYRTSLLQGSQHHLIILIDDFEFSFPLIKVEWTIQALGWVRVELAGSHIPICHNLLLLTYYVQLFNQRINLG